MKRLPFAESTGSGGRFNQFQRVSTLDGVVESGLVLY